MKKRANINCLVFFRCSQFLQRFCDSLSNLRNTAQLDVILVSIFVLIMIEREALT